MGLLSNQISRDKLKPGDHIYSWRTAYIYSHHGIYIGDEKVIHFTRGGGLETGTGTFLDKFIASSVPNHGGNNNPCPNCGDLSNLDGVISSCLDCFLSGGNLYLFEYNVSPGFFLAKQRGTCTTATSDPCDEVISRANLLLDRNGFGAYHLIENNCEDFAIYCKTGLVVMSKIKFGSSGQANSATVAQSVFSWTFNNLFSGGKKASVVSSTLGYPFTGFGGAVFMGYGKYCFDLLLSDIGMRSDVTKVPVENLVSIIKLLEGRSEEAKNPVQETMAVEETPKPLVAEESNSTSLENRIDQYNEEGDVAEEGEIVGGEGEGEVDESSKSAVPQSHPLEHSWTFWFDNPSVKSKQTTWGSSLRSVFTFSTVEEFWSLYNNMRHPSKLAHGADFYCFKHNIEPKWEDPICANGGKWTMNFPKEKSDKPWLYTLLALIGEQFDHGDEICGAVVNIRAKERISIWTKNASNDAAQVSIGKQWKEFLDYNSNIGFIIHEEAKKLDRNAKSAYTV